MNDYLSFRKMITPTLLRASFWILSIVILLLAITGYRNGTLDLWTALALAGLGTVAVRLFTEAGILFFGMHETLNDIRSNTLRVGSRDAAATWSPPRIDRDLDPLSRLEALDQYAGDLWDACSIDAEDTELQEQVAELESEPREYLKAVRHIRHATNQLGRETSDPSEKDRGAIATASTKLSHSLESMESYIRILVRIDETDGQVDDAASQLAEQEHAFDHSYRAFAEAMRAMDDSYLTAFEPDAVVGS